MKKNDYWHFLPSNCANNRFFEQKQETDHPGWITANFSQFSMKFSIFHLIAADLFVKNNAKFLFNVSSTNSEYRQLCV